MDINKIEDQPIFTKTLSAEETQRETDLVNVIARLGEAVNIVVGGSLDTRFDDLEASAADLISAIAGILDGSVSFTSIDLGSAVILEASVTFNAGGHDHSGGAAGKAVAHSSTDGITANDHHDEEHDINSHTGALNLSTADNAASLFQNLTEVSNTIGIALSGHTGDTDAHHPQNHGFDDHSGSLNDVNIIVSDPNITAVNGSEAFAEIALALKGHVTSTGNVHGLALGDIGAANALDFQAHLDDADGHNNVISNASAITSLGNAMLAAQSDIVDLEGQAVSLDGRTTILEAGLLTKLNTTDFDSTLGAFSGILGGVSPLENVLSDAATIIDLTVSTIAGLVGLETEDLTVTGDVLLPEGSVSQTMIEKSSQLQTWHNAPAHLLDELNNIRHMLSMVSGEPAWNADGANPPQFSATSDFGGVSLKSQAEYSWYREWFAGSNLIKGLIIDVFEDDTGQASGTAEIEDGYLGVGTFESRLYSFSPAELYVVDYVIMHVEASGVFTVQITADNGGNWDNVAILDNEKPLTVSGRDIKIRITVSSGKVYSYGVLLGSSI